MAESHPPSSDHVPIGNVVVPASVRLPVPSTLFRRRAERLCSLAIGHPLAPYLFFLARLAGIQHKLQAHLLAPKLPETDALLRARQLGLPPLDRERAVTASALNDALNLMAVYACELDMPSDAAEALARVAGADDIKRNAMIDAILTMPSQINMPAEHGFVAAALQAHFAMLAAQLHPTSLAREGDSACPACGYPPAASMIVGWPGAHGARYCGCALCGTLWHTVRIKCTLCGSTAGITYQEIEGRPGIVKAEACMTCNRYLKIFAQDVDPAADVVADDVASLGLDLLMQGTGFWRGGVNPFVNGY